MFHHVSVGVKDLDRAAAFYEPALAALGYVRLFRHPRAVGFGPEGFEGEAPFAIVTGGLEANPPGKGFHIAFAAPDREAVDRFHAAALAAGGIDEGPPGIRENYDPSYYAAFVRDPDGHRLEAVLFGRPAGSSHRSGPRFARAHLRRAGASHRPSSGRRAGENPRVRRFPRG